MSPLASTLQEIIGKRSVEEVAQEWGIKAWRLRDIMRGHTKRPRDPAELRAIAAGSGIPYERILVLAHEPNGDCPANGESPPSAPPEA